MRLLYIDNKLLDIDDQTAIGIDLQNYDIKEPAKTKVKVSNTFTIPVTNNNLSIIGWLGRHQNLSNSVYGAKYCNYYVNNVQFIKQAKVRVKSISDRIELYVFEVPDIFDTLKTVKWGTFTSLFYIWLDLPSVFNKYTGTMAGFLDSYIDGTDSKLWLPYLKSNPLDTEFYMNLGGGKGGKFYSGGHFCVYVKKVFEYIEETYSVNFFSDGDAFTGNVWEDEIISKVTFLFRELTPSSDSASTFFFIKQNETFIGWDDTLEETQDKTLYDFIIAFMQHFNIVVTETDEGFKMRRFDYILDTDVIDYSPKLTGIPVFKPDIEGFAKSNTIKFASVEDGISPDTNQRVLASENQGLTDTKELFKINAFMPYFVMEDNGVKALNVIVPNYATKTSFKNFKFLVNSGSKAITSPDTIQIFIAGDPTSSITTSDLNAAALYSLDSEYLAFEGAIQYPVYYEAKIWLTPMQVFNFDFFKQYYIKQLGGSFYVNKIKGFNPELSKEATTVELIKISDKYPDNSAGEGDYFTDGLGNVFTDGVNNKYI